MLSALFPMLWNAADNDVGVSANMCTNYRKCNGAALVGGPDDHDPDMLAKMSSSDLDAAMSKLGSGMGIGVGYGSSGGRGVHSGSGWDSHGSVTCHRCVSTLPASTVCVACFSPSRPFPESVWPASPLRDHLDRHRIHSLSPLLQLCPLPTLPPATGAK